MAKQVLITGINSYIGNSFERYVKEHYGDTLTISKTSLRENSWEEEDWSNYDAILHVAGIAHVDIQNADEATQNQYFAVNTKLTHSAAAKAKAEGVGQFVFLSSMIVYGDAAPVGKRKTITAETEPAPANFYGESKLRAEGKLKELQDDAFHIAIVRPPFIYGPGCKGNYKKMASFARKMPVFPRIANERSMLYIENLTELLAQIILQEKEGVFLPQNEAYVNTSEMVRSIAEVNGKTIRLIPGLGGFARIGAFFHPVFNKVFGTMVYDAAASKVQGIDYQKVDFGTSVRRSEGKA
ncbi:MAG: NAD-dependent epimerase/dehydratase family protein [Lachnospiraceae bacterium]|nr:NAD-dependent epimerase/dehydratase family protein [Lachnospiraceae bacterium]